MENVSKRNEEFCSFVIHQKLTMSVSVEQTVRTEIINTLIWSLKPEFVILETISWLYINIPFFTIVLHLNGSSAITQLRLPFTPPFNSLESHQHWLLPTLVAQITVMLMTRKKPCRYQSSNLPCHSFVIHGAFSYWSLNTIRLKVGTAQPSGSCLINSLTSCLNFLQLLMREKWLLFGIILSVPIRDHDRNTSQVFPDPPPNWAQKDAKSETNIIMQDEPKSNDSMWTVPFHFLSQRYSYAVNHFREFH